MTGDVLPPTSYWDFKENGEGDKFLDESVGHTFGVEFLRDPTVSENDVIQEGDVVTLEVNFTYLVFYRPVFHNIVSQPNIYEYGHALMGDHGNYF